MALLLPCENEISAHVLRSRLLSHGVECVIVHENAATLWGGWLFRPRLMVADDDWDLACDFCAQDADSIDESFVEPLETADLNENLGFSSIVPDLLAMALVGFALGAVELAVVTVFTMATGGMSREVAEESAALFLPLYGAAAGLIAWPFVWLARSCRLRADGTLPLRARLIFLGALPEAWLGLAIYFLLRLLFAILPKALRK